MDLSGTMAVLFLLGYLVGMVQIAIKTILMSALRRIGREGYTAE